MTPLAWSFLLSAVGIVGILLAGSKRKIGWLVGFFVQPLWIVFAITTGQYGFILNAVIYAVVYARNWLRWRREERPPTVGPNPYRKGSPGNSYCQTAGCIFRYDTPHVDCMVSEARRVMDVKPPTVGPKGGAGNSGASRR